MGLVLDTVTVEGNVDIGGNITKGGATISLPTSTDTIVLLTESQTLTNKTLSGASNTFSNIATSSLTGTLQSTQFPALTGDVTTTAGSLATTIAANAVSNTKLAQVSTQTFKGRTTAGSGNVEDLSGTQATAMLDVFGADSGAGGVKGLVPATIAGDAARFLRGDGTWQPNGSGTVTSVSVTTANGVSGSVATATSTPAISITLGAITPSSVAAVGTVTGSNLSGSNTGDQTITLTGDVTGSGTGSFATTIGALKVTNSMLAGSIAFSKLVGTDITAVGTLVNLTVTNPITGSITGNAGTATALQTARAINGVSFDGTAPITITAAAGTLTGTTLNATVVTSSLTSVGTLANLTVTNPINGSITGNAASVTTNANLTGPITSSGNATSVSTNAITNTMLAQVATATFKGRTTAATGNVEDLTAAQATAILNVFGGDAGAGGVKGLVPATVSGDATKYLKGDGTWAAIAGSGTVTSVSITTANGVSGSVATATTTPAITLTLGAITPSSVAASGTVTGSNLSGTNTGDSVFGTQYQYAESNTNSTNATATMTTKVTFTTPVIPAGTYRVGFMYQFLHSATTSDFRAQCRVDAVNIHFHNEEVSDATTIDISSGFRHLALTNAAHTIDIQFAAEAGTATISNARIEIWRVA